MKMPASKYFELSLVSHKAKLALTAQKHRLKYKKMGFFFKVNHLEKSKAIMQSLKKIKLSLCEKTDM